MKASERDRAIIAAVRKIKVISVDCRFSDKGVLRSRTTLKINGSTVEMSTVSERTIAAVLSRSLGVETLPDAAYDWMDRVIGDYRAKLHAHPVYASMAEVRERRRQPHLFDDRLSRLVDGAAGMDLGELLERVTAAYGAKLARDVMES